jgi:hypothetical protein
MKKGKANALKNRRLEKRHGFCVIDVGAVQGVF